jgi:cytochrome c oxidase assembly protein subunit 15
MFRPETPASPWLRRFALLLVFATLVLLALGGLVTSHGVGMAVPDWPNTYGYNMFAFPVSKWVGGILYEHSHRLMAACVGLLTTLLAAWLWMRETRSREKWLGLGAIVLVLVLMGIRVLPVYVMLAALALMAAAFSLYQIHQKPGALRWWGMLAFAVVIFQGVLGGLRVVWFKDQIGIFHAALAQLFFVLVCVISYLTRYAVVLPSPGAAISTRGLQHSNAVVPETVALGDGRAPLPLRQLFLTATLLIFVQLVLGATMRHQHAGLAIPDFPLAYGKLWPAMDAGSITLYNQHRLETLALNSITAFQVGLQMAHRLVAVSICVVVACCCWLAWRQLGARHSVSRRALVWLGLILAQGLLGAATIWSNKAADIATAHVLVGALALASGTLLWLVCPPGEATARRETSVRAMTATPFGAQTSAAHGLD